MTVVYAEVVIWTKYIRRNDGRKQTAMLLAVGTARTMRHRQTDRQTDRQTHCAVHIKQTPNIQYTGWVKKSKLLYVGG